MRPSLLAAVVLVCAVAGCTSSTTMVDTVTVAGSGVPAGQVRPVNLTDAEIEAVRRDTALAFNDPTRPFFDPIAGAEDSAGVRYACSNVVAGGGGTVTPGSGLPFGGMFTKTGFQVIAKGGTTVETRAAEDYCGRLGIRPRRV